MCSAEGSGNNRKHELIETIVYAFVFFSRTPEIFPFLFFFFKDSFIHLRERENGEGDRGRGRESERGHLQQTPCQAPSLTQGSISHDP